MICDSEGGHDPQVDIEMKGPFTREKDETPTIKWRIIKHFVTWGLVC